MVSSGLCSSISSSMVSSGLCSFRSSSISLLPTSRLLIFARHNLVDYRLHRVLSLLNEGLRLLNVTFASALRPKLLPSRSESSLGNPFPCLFDHFEAGNDVEVILLIFSEREVGPCLIRTHHWITSLIRIKAN
ncbi:hypothetical protein AVEN_182495-1 [Araneus ventricosus]|uniref:Uncharacterized protein n=1 Tax=Araneus ventricosus TaxID=182803 RepID=A0A4Y2BXL1_ARAVE|nr:hypothetical protein AVEN_182495-1 [Araneus ventricosus]